MRKHPLDILGKNVELEVYQAANVGAAKVGVTFRMRDDPDRETLLRNRSDCQADPIDGNRPFASDITRELAGSFNCEATRPSPLLPPDERRCALTMAQHLTSAEPAGSANSALKLCRARLSQGPTPG